MRFPNLPRKKVTSEECGMSIHNLCSGFAMLGFNQLCNCECHGGTSND